MQGNRVYSCDCFGTLIEWDVRVKTGHIKTWELGPYSVNSLTVDPAGMGGANVLLTVCSVLHVHRISGVLCQ